MGVFGCLGAGGPGGKGNGFDNVKVVFEMCAISYICATDSSWCNSPSDLEAQGICLRGPSG